MILFNLNVVHVSILISIMILCIFLSVMPLGIHTNTLFTLIAISNQSAFYTDKKTPGL